MTITRTKVREISADINEALKAVAEKHGVAINTDGARFTDDSINFKLVVMAGSGADSGKSAAILKAERDWKLHAKLHGVDEAMLGKEIVFGRSLYTVAGWLPRCHKYPVLAISAKNGTEYKLPVEAVKK